jgi:hypothetical protein
MNIENVINALFDNNVEDTYYSEVHGFSRNVNVYRNFTHIYAKIFFKVLDNFKLDYYTFAGTSIGYIRNKQNIPWVDDYDIIIFEEEIEYFTAGTILNDTNYIKKIILTPTIKI